MRKEFDEYHGLSVTFHVTEDCNLRCKYCYQAHRKPRQMKIEDAKAFIDHLLTEKDPINAIGTDTEWLLDAGLILDFMGGDALMRPEFVDEIMQYFIWKAHAMDHRWKDRWRMCISSNGTLFDRPAVRAMCEKYQKNLSLGVSIDGVREIQEINREGSFDKIIEGWDYYRKLVGEENIRTKATCNRESIPYLADSVRFLYEKMGLKYVNMNFIFEDIGITDADLEELDRQLAKVVDFVYDTDNDFYLSMIDRHKANSTKMTDPKRGWCGAGSMPTLSVDGKIYPCFRFVPDTATENVNAEGHNVSVGSAKDGFTNKEVFEFIRSQTREKVSPPECLECDVESSCAWCIGSSFGESGKFYRQTHICKIHKLQVKHAREYWRRHDEREAARG